MVYYLLLQAYKSEPAYFSKDWVKLKQRQGGKVSRFPCVYSSFRLCAGLDEPDAPLDEHYALPDAQPFAAFSPFFFGSSSASSPDSNGSNVRSPSHSDPRMRTKNPTKRTQRRVVVEDAHEGDQGLEPQGCSQTRDSPHDRG